MPQCVVPALQTRKYHPTIFPGDDSISRQRWPARASCPATASSPLDLSLCRLPKWGQTTLWRALNWVPTSTKLLADTTKTEHTRQSSTGKTCSENMLLRLGSPICRSTKCPFCRFRAWALFLVLVCMHMLNAVLLSSHQNRRHKQWTELSPQLALSVQECKH